MSYTDYNDYSTPRPNGGTTYGGGGGGGGGGRNPLPNPPHAPAPSQRRIPPPRYSGEVGGVTAAGSPLPTGLKTRPLHVMPPTSPNAPARTCTVVKASTDAYALANKLAVSPGDWPPDLRYVLVEDAFAFAIAQDHGLASGQAAPSAMMRQWAGLSLGQRVTMRGFDPYASGQCLGSMDVEIGFLRRGQAASEAYSQDDLANVFKRVFAEQPFAPTQQLVFDFKGTNIKAMVRGVSLVSFNDMLLHEKPGAAMPLPDTGSQSARGLLLSNTDVNFFKDPTSLIQIKASTKRPPPNAILQPNFKFEDMGIGGLDNEFSAIFRRAFASRLLPPGLIEKLGIQHVKGLLLYGPPGTGKTLMARRIGKMLNAREPKVVNGPEILSKFVGQSEENIRKLFADAETEYKQKGDESGLHIIIFDEIDAICKQRGSGNTGGTGVGDSVVNQLLSKMDGVDELNNVLIIGMTNRLDMIDEALLRPGRFESQVEISLPDEKGRLQILKIHTNKMRTNGIMDSDVDLEELANLTKNFSGAEIAGLVKSASSFAFNRHIKVGTTANLGDDIQNVKVNRSDFYSALEEVRPAYGAQEAELGACVPNGIMRWSPDVDRILGEGRLYVEQVRQSDRTSLVSALIYGSPGAGKTALAATIAMSSGFPFIKLVSPEACLGYSEAAKVQYITKVFNDSTKSPLSVVVVDGIERLLDWVSIGPRFSNAVLQALLVLLTKRPPQGKRLLILATTSSIDILHQMDMISAFDRQVEARPVQCLDHLQILITETALFGPAGSSEAERGRKAVLARLAQINIAQTEEETLVVGDAPGTKRVLSLGVKKVLSIIESARQESDPANRVEQLCYLISSAL